MTPWHVGNAGVCAALMATGAVLLALRPGWRATRVAWIVVLAAGLTNALALDLQPTNLLHINLIHHYLGAKYAIPYRDFYRVVRAASGQPQVGYRDLAHPGSMVRTTRREQRGYYIDLLRGAGVAFDPMAPLDTLARRAQESGAVEHEAERILSRHLPAGRIEEFRTDVRRATAGLTNQVLIGDYGFNGSPFYALLRQVDPTLHLPFGPAVGWLNLAWQVLGTLLLAWVAGAALGLCLGERLGVAALLFASWDFVGYALPGLIFAEVWLPVAIAALAMRQRRAVAAGVAIAWAGLIKLFPFVLVLPVVTRLAREAVHRWRTRVASEASAAGAIGAASEVPVDAGLVSEAASDAPVSAGLASGAAADAPVATSAAPDELAGAGPSTGPGSGAGSGGTTDAAPGADAEPATLTAAGPATAASRATAWSLRLLAGCALAVPVLGVAALLSGRSWGDFVAKIAAEFHSGAIIVNSASLVALFHTLGLADVSALVPVLAVVALAILAAMFWGADDAAFIATLPRRSLVVLAAMGWVLPNWLNYYAIVPLLLLPHYAREHRAGTVAAALSLAAANLLPGFDDPVLLAQPGLHGLKLLPYLLVPAWMVATELRDIPYGRTARRLVLLAGLLPLVGVAEEAWRARVIQRLDAEGQRRLDAGDAAGALARYRQVVWLAPWTANARMNQAIALAALGRMDEATASFARAAALAPESPAAQDNYGRALMMQGRLEDAARRLEAARALSPYDPQILMALARVRREQNRRADSAALFARAQELEPEAWRSRR